MSCHFRKWLKTTLPDMGECLIIFNQLKVKCKKSVLGQVGRIPDSSILVVTSCCGFMQSKVGPCRHHIIFSVPGIPE